MLTKETKVDKIEVLEDGQLQVREATIIMDDGKEISRAFHRYVLDPDRDEDKLPNQDPRIQGIASIVWTPEAKEARKAARRKNSSGMSMIV